MDGATGFNSDPLYQPFVIRIVLPSGEAADWRIEDEISFHDVLDVLKRVLPQVSVTAFEYEDEDGDRITVRSDDELQAMVNWHTWNNCQRFRNGTMPEPLLIYPKVSRTSGRRNMLGLTVDVDAAPSPQSNREGSGGGSSGRKQHGDIQNILSSGQIYQQDIQHLELMGFGSAGTVYKCIHIPTQRVMATKVIALNVSLDVQRQIISELDILFQCRSPFIIGFYGAFFTEGKISVCTEFMNGGSLDTYGAVPEPVLARVSISVVKGLVYLWNLKIMHRDMKPSNMLVNTNGEVKICDFGVSIQLVNSIAKTFVGTNAYMACRSPFIIGFYGAFFTEGKISVCTEFMNGGSLDTYGAVPEPVLARVSISVVKGLVYLWNLKIMHRDMKPSNMLVNTNGEVKICDFGVSIQLVNSIAKTFVGTNAYMAPERLRGDEYGVHSDVWSLGISLVEMATGNFPYPTDSSRKDENLQAIELIQCILNEDPPRLSTENFSAEFVDFISRCLSKSSQYRPRPEDLLEHNFIKRNDDGRRDIIAAFVMQKPSERGINSHR